MKLRKFLLFTTMLAAVSNVALATGAAYFAPSMVLTTLTTRNSNFTGLAPRIAVGYGDALGPNFYLAGEISGTIGGLTLKNNVSTLYGGQSVKATWNYGASLIPSVCINKETTGFMRIGALASHFESSNKTDPGIMLGLGLATEVDENMALSAEYTYSFYRAMPGLGSPKADMFMLGAVRKFNL